MNVYLFIREVLPREISKGLQKASRAGKRGKDGILGDVSLPCLFLQWSQEHKLNSFIQLQAKCLGF